MGSCRGGRALLGALALLVALGLGAPRPVPAERAATQPRKLERGILLVASRQITGPFFAKTVVLLIEYGPGGALGLILNRPTRVGLEELLPEVAASGDPGEPIYFGGPVDRSALMVLVRSATAPPHSRPIVADLFATGSRETLKGLLSSESGATTFRVFVGSAGWAPGQLDHERARGDWFLAPVEPDVILGDGAKDLWPELIQRYEGIEVDRGRRSPIVDASG
ncbi:MAG: YqgE/AlgH family protein [Myxococcota bacterium]